MILLLSHSKDIHVQALLNLYSSASDSIMFLNESNLDNFSVCLSKSRHIIKASGKDIDLDSIKSVWVRKYSSIPHLINNTKIVENNVTPLITENDLQQVHKAENIVTVFRELSLFLQKSNKFIVNSFIDNLKGNYKFNQLVRAKEVGLLTPDYIITNDSSKIREFLSDKDKDFVIKRIVPKSVRYGYLEKRFYTYEIRLEDIPQQADYYNHYLFIEERIEKLYELRITAIGKNFFCTKITYTEDKEDSISKLDWRYDDSLINYSVTDIPKNIKKACEELMKWYHLQYCTFDFIVDKTGNYVFLELNPNGQYYWIENKTGQEITAQMKLLLENPQKYKL